MSDHQGIVAKIFSNPGRGDTMLYSFALAGETRTYYGMGEDKPKFPEGAAIRFKHYENKRGYPTVDGKVLKWEGEAADVAAEAAKKTKSSYSGRKGSGGTGQDWKERWISADEQRVKDKVIQLQSCRNSALQMLDILVSSEALKLPAQAKRVDFMEELLRKYIEMFLGENGYAGVGVADEEPEPEETEQEDEGVWD